MKDTDTLLEAIAKLLVEHVGEAPDAQKRNRSIEALACAQAAGEAFHAFVCRGQDFCPRQAANMLTEAMLNDVQSAVGRAFGAGGYIQ